MAEQSWFLSYNSKDQALAARVRDALQAKCPEAFIYFAPTSLRAGSYWLPELAKAIAETTTFVLLVGEHGLGPWQVSEYYEALDRRVKELAFPLIPLLLDGQLAPGLPFMRQLHWIITSDPAAEKSIGLVLDASRGGGTTLSEPWRHTAPYRGLDAMTEADSDFFFGRGKETVEVLKVLASEPDRIPILLGNSGVGKSSLARAGVVASLMREAWPDDAMASQTWPQNLKESRRWCFLAMRPGTEPVKALVQTLVDTWRIESTSAAQSVTCNEWVDALLHEKASLSDLLRQTCKRFEELQLECPPAFFLYVDQGEELFVQSEERQQQCFSRLLAAAVSDPRLRVLLSIRADFLGELQKDEALFRVRHNIDVPPMRELELREVVARPASLLGARFETDRLASDIARRAAEESTKDAGALPLLSYLLDDMWRAMPERGENILRLPADAIELGGVLVERANAFVEKYPAREEVLKRIFTLKLAAVREDGEPTRRRAPRSEFSDEEWLLVSELADHPNRLLNTIAPEGGENYAEVAHEAIFRRWDKLKDWIAAEREFLIWKSGLESARRAWLLASNESKHGALLMGLALRNAQSRIATRAQDISTLDQKFIVLSSNAARQRQLLLQVTVAVPALVILAGVIGWVNQAWFEDRWRWYTVIQPYLTAKVQPYVLSAEREQALKPMDAFKECSGACPEMVVVRAGRFMMGSRSNEPGHFDNESDAAGRQHSVVFKRPFAISKFEVTFAEWDVCVAYGNCDPKVSDSGWGRGQQPVVNVSWDEAKTYVKWLAQITGKSYRLASEAEWEYTARAGTETAYSWGDEIGKGHTNCNGCGSQWDNRQPAPVGSFAPNAWGIYDMEGNVWQWVDDCYHDNFDGAPSSGTPWLSEVCRRHVVRGGSCYSIPRRIRSASRSGQVAAYRGNDGAFRIARTL